MELINPLIENYIAQFTSPEPIELEEVNKATVAIHPLAHMISGHVQGQFLV